MKYEEVSYHREKCANTKHNSFHSPLARNVKFHYKWTARVFWFYKTEIFGHMAPKRSEDGHFKRSYIFIYVVE